MLGWRYSLKTLSLFLSNFWLKFYRSKRTRAIFKKSCLNAQIKKTVTPHNFRHNYTAHILENGTDIRYIQSLLRHANRGNNNDLNTCKAQRLNGHQESVRCCSTKN